MRRLISHTAVKLGILIMMSASSMGFTTVFSYCTMSHSLECCCSDEHHNHTKSQSTAPELSDQKVSCNIQIVAGGLTPVALNTFSDVSAKSIVLDLIASDSGVPTISAVPHLPLLAHANDIAPPKVDIYISGGSLLI